MLGQGPGWGMMSGPWGGFTGAFNMIPWLLVLVLVVVAVIWFARSGRNANLPAQSDPRSRGLDVLEERYARGEIDREEYLQKKRDLTG